jgi:hypothetical protein
MGQDPAFIREEIERTREHIGEKVDALGYKADLPARTKEAISEKVDLVRSKVSGMGSHISDATPDAGDVEQGARRAAGVAQENPLGLAVGAAAVGFLAGMLVPVTRLEDERIGVVAEEVRQQAKHTGEETLEHGKQIAGDTAEAARESLRRAASEVGRVATESAEAHTHEVSESAKASAQQVQEAARGA